MRATYIPKQFSTSRPRMIDFGSRAQHRRSIDGFLGQLTAESVASEYLFYSPVGDFRHREDRYRLARYVFLGPEADDAPIRLGIFAGIHGDENMVCAALVEFLRALHREPERARGYQIFAYPICNPTGFEDATHESRSGHDLNHEFWQGSRQPEVYYLERELGVIGFHGVISLHAGENDGVFAHVRARTLAEALVQSALEAAARFLPVASSPAEALCAAAEATGRKCHEGALVSAAEMKPAPFEIVLEMPRHAPGDLQIAATIAALDQIVAAYRPFLAARQNI